MNPNLSYFVVSKGLYQPVEICAWGLCRVRCIVLYKQQPLCVCVCMYMCISMASSYRMYRNSCRGGSPCIWRQTLFGNRAEGAYHHKSGISMNAK